MWPTLPSTFSVGYANSLPGFATSERGELLSVSENRTRLETVDAAGMNLYQPLLNELLASRDNLRHRILFDYPAYEYVIPCEIVVEPERRAVAIVAYTTHHLPEHRMADAAALAALSCLHDFPTVIIDEPTRRALTIYPVAPQDLKTEALLDWIVASTVRRLLSVARRIDLCADGLSIATAAAISEAELLRALVPLRQYRPFRKAE